jgi:hypothetical protein
MLNEKRRQWKASASKFLSGGERVPISVSPNMLPLLGQQQNLAVVIRYSRFLVSIFLYNKAD